MMIHNFYVDCIRAF